MDGRGRKVERMDICFEGLRIILGREDVSRKVIPQSNRGREKRSSVFYRATEPSSDNIGVCLSRLTGGNNRIVERRNNTQ